MGAERARRAGAGRPRAAEVPRVDLAAAGQEGRAVRLRREVHDRARGGGLLGEGCAQ